MRMLIVLVAWGLSALAATAATYDAFATGWLRPAAALPAGIVVDIAPGAFGTEAFALGDAEAFRDAAQEIAGAEVATGAAAWGSAGPYAGYSIASVRTETFYDVANLGPAAVTLDFAFEWEIAATATAAPGELSFALAEASVFGTDLDPDGLPLSVPLAGGLLDVDSAGLSSGLTEGALSGTDVFSLFLNAGETAFLNVFVEATGFAEGVSTIPVPAPALTLLAGLALLTALRRRAA